MPDQDFESGACSKASISDSDQSDSDSGLSSAHHVTRQSLATVDPLKKVRAGSVGKPKTKMGHGHALECANRADISTVGLRRHRGNRHQLTLSRFPQGKKAKPVWSVLAGGSLFWYSSHALDKLKGDVKMQGTCVQVGGGSPESASVGVQVTTEPCITAG